ncbi:MAG: hypothetical protein ACTH2J_11750, partial [Candidatus Microbacterium stercoravium]
MAEDNNNATSARSEKAPSDEAHIESAESAAATEHTARTASDENPDPTPSNDDKPEIPTAVGLGLIEENFVSRVSTVLNFYAPDVRLLPPMPAFHDDDDDDVDRHGEGNRSSRRRRRRGSDRPSNN